MALRVFHYETFEPYISLTHARSLKSRPKHRALAEFRNRTRGPRARSNQRLECACSGLAQPVLRSILRLSRNEPGLRQGNCSSRSSRTNSTTAVLGSIEPHAHPQPEGQVAAWQRAGCRQPRNACAAGLERPQAAFFRCGPPPQWALLTKPRLRPCRASGARALVRGGGVFARQKHNARLRAGRV
jgi:hypothetical protein